MSTTRLKIQTKEIKRNNLQIRATICQVSQPWAFFFSARSDGTIVCPQTLGLIRLFCPEALERSRPLGCEFLHSHLSFCSFSLCHPQDCNNIQGLVVLVGSNPLSNSTPPCRRRASALSPAVASCTRRGLVPRRAGPDPLA